MTMILGINMAVPPFSLGLLDENGNDYSQSFGSSGLGENLISQIEKSCENAGIALDKLTGIGIVSGPGNYTGIRLGVTVSKTISQLMNIPVFGFGSTACIAHAMYPHNQLIYTVFPGRKNEYNCALYSCSGKAPKAITPDFTISADVLAAKLSQSEEPVLIAGQHISSLEEKVNASAPLRFKSVKIDPTLVARLAQRAILEKKAGGYAFLKAHYSYDSVTAR
jgi:tRNA threonylcarbamoyladenosine biosynthesis protein TsaB